MRVSRSPVLAAAALCAAVAIAPAARAATYCRSTDTATYCNDGTTFYQYGDRIQSNRGESWTKFGSHIYGSDGSWFADHGDGVTSWFPDDPDPLSARIVPDRLFGEDHDED